MSIRSLFIKPTGYASAEPLLEFAIQLSNAIGPADRLSCSPELVANADRSQRQGRFCSRQVLSDWQIILPDGVALMARDACRANNEHTRRRATIVLKFEGIKAKRKERGHKPIGVSCALRQLSRSTAAPPKLISSGVSCPAASRSDCCALGLRVNRWRACCGEGNSFDRHFDAVGSSINGFRHIPFDSCGAVDR